MDYEYFHLMTLHLCRDGSSDTLVCECFENVVSHSSVTVYTVFGFVLGTDLHLGRSA